MVASPRGGSADK